MNVINSTVWFAYGMVGGTLLHGALGFGLVQLQWRKRNGKAFGMLLGRLVWA
jgi:hypothetical protein